MIMRHDHPLSKRAKRTVGLEAKKKRGKVYINKFRMIAHRLIRRAYGCSGMLLTYLVTTMKPLRSPILIP